MKVIVLGNVGSGKSFLVKALHDLIPLEIVAIDDYRCKYSDGSKSGEKYAREKFFSRVCSTANQYVECTGYGEVGDELLDTMKKMKQKTICIVLHAPPEICKARAKAKSWDIPFPLATTNIAPFIERVDKKVNSGEITDQWKTVEECIVIEKDTTKQEFQTSIVHEIADLIAGQIDFLNGGETELFSSSSIQTYYGNEYLSYQRQLVQRSADMLADRQMIISFLQKEHITGSVIDIGAGDCQWFSSIENTIRHYYAIDINQSALALSPKDSKLTTIATNIFAKGHGIENFETGSDDCMLFSFFLSHFSDDTIRSLLCELGFCVQTIYIIDSLWNSKTQKRTRKKQLSLLTRKNAADSKIFLPKRYFELSDIDQLATSSGYHVRHVESGNVWFIAKLTRSDTL